MSKNMKLAIGLTIAGVGLLTGSSTDALADECEPVTSLEVTYHYQGNSTTTKVRIDPLSARNPEDALKSFQRVADHFGQANVVSSRTISEVACYAPGSSQLMRLREGKRGVALSSGGMLCADANGIFSCDELTPDHSYNYGGTDSCSITNLGELVSVACPESGAIVSRRGDVVLSVNADNIRADVLSRTAALRRLVGDENVLTNLHFNIVISPEQQASVVNNQELNGMVQAIRQASQMGQPLPDIQDLLDALPNTPQNVQFFEQLVAAHARREQRLELLAGIVNGTPLSTEQVEAFFEDFIGKSQLVDRLVVENTAAALVQAADVVNEKIMQLMMADPASSVYEQVKTGVRAFLDAHTKSGVFDPENILEFVPPLEKFLTDEDFEKRMVAADHMIRSNQAMRKTTGDEMYMQFYLRTMQPLSNLLYLLMEEDKMDAVWRVYDRVESSEFFIETGDPVGTRYDVHLDETAQSMFQIDVEPTSAAAYDVIMLLNEVAEYHQATGKITIDYQAIIEVNARAALSTADAIRQLYHTEEAYTWFAFAGDFLGGMIDNFKDTASGVFYMASHPLETFEGLKAAIVNWDQTLALVWEQGAELIHRWPNMTPQEKANFMGQVAAEVISSLPAKARQAGRLNEAARDAVRLHLDKANRGLQIIERTGVPLSPKAASELARRMEELGLSSLDEIEVVADKLDDFLPCRLTNHLLRYGVLALRPPCTEAELQKVFQRLESEVAYNALSRADRRATMLGICEAGLKKVGDSWYWDGNGGSLFYRPRLDDGNALLHMLKHAEENWDKPDHGVFIGGRRRVPRLVNEAWQKVLDGSPDAVLIGQEDGVKVYQVFMGRDVGYLGGSNHKHDNPRRMAQHIKILIRNGSELETAYPVKR